MHKLCSTVIAVSLVLSPLFSSAQAPQLQTSEKPDLSKEPTLYVVGYAHLDTEWRWEYPQVIDEYIRKTMEDNFKLFEKYPHYVFNFSGANRYRFMKEYFPADYAKVKQYVDQGRWFPAGSSMEEGDVNAPSGEAIIRQILYGNDWFRKEFGKASNEYMLPDCFGFPASLPTILASSGVKGFSTQKLVWGSSANAGGRESLEKTPEGTPFNVGVWVGPDGESVLAGLNPGAYSGGIYSDLSKPLPTPAKNSAFADLEKKAGDLQKVLQQAEENKSPIDEKQLQEYFALRGEQAALTRAERDQEAQRYQGDWAARVMQNGKTSGLFTDYHYFGTGDIGGAPDENSVKLLEAIVTKGEANLNEGRYRRRGDNNSSEPEVKDSKVGDGPVHVISATADQMFLNITPAEASTLPRYTGEMELTNHSAGSLTSQAYQKRWIRQEEILADEAEKSSIAAEWLGARTYPQERLNDAWTLAMGAHFHDIAAGTATPRSYEFAWNDDVIAMNQFAGVFTNASEAVAASLNTQAKGIPLVVFNPLNIAREDVVEATVDFHGAAPKAVRVTSPDGKEVPAQISGNKILFPASLPSVAYAVYDVEPVDSASAPISALHVSKDGMENEYYRVKLNADGDVSSIFDKTVNKELLAAPARLAISYDNPQLWPAWNMDWEQEQAAPKSYVSGPATIKVVEDGPVRVGIEIARETAGSRFVQTIRLSAGDAGKRVEFGNVIDWNTRESNLKATFPLTASNEMATYNWDIGTIQRPTAQPKKFEVPSHQWIDLTDASGEYGATVLTDDKNGSDKPNDNTIRLTLIRTPGIAGGYADQATQDIGHHEFTYGIAGHALSWRESQTDWQAQRLNSPLIAFATTSHDGAAGKLFSLLKVSDPRVRVLAVKKAELSDEVVIRLVELDGKPKSDVKVSFASAIASAREVNGQEQPIGSATVTDGSLVTNFGGYQPRTFALKLTPAPTKLDAVKSTPVSLHYALATATSDGEKTQGGFNKKGDALPAEMLPAQISFNDVQFQLAPSKTGTPNAITAKGQKIALPEGTYNRVYILAASSDGDQKATFEIGTKKTELNIQDWSGFVGQWDDRQWSSPDTSHDSYGDMIGLKPGFIKRADLAWYASHHHDATGRNVPYSYSYLYGYSLELASGSKTIQLPKNEKIKILAISVASENPGLTAAHPLYDVLPSPNAGASDFTLSSSSAKLHVPQGNATTTRILVMPRGNFDGKIKLSATGLPAGVTASFDPELTTGSSTLTLTTSKATSPASSTVTITGVAGDLSRSFTTEVAVTAVLTNTVPVDLSSAYNVTGIYKDGSKFQPSASFDNGGYSFSAEALGTEQVGDGVVFKFGPPNAPDAVSSKTISLPSGKFTALKVLATAVEGNQEQQTFTVNYTDGTSASFTRSLSDWANASNLEDELDGVDVSYRLEGGGDKDGNPFHIHTYSFDLDQGKTPQSLTLPSNRQVIVLAATLVSAK
jgi:alpha-mannosidase